jgi:hypothetical protein
MEKQDKKEIRKIYPKTLQPPPEVVKHMMEKDKQKLPANPVLRFFKIFFGEGY